MALSPTLALIRFMDTREGTLGLLMANGRKICLMGELPWRDNRSDISCIPAGTYRVDYLPSSGSGRYRDVYHVQAVPGRFGILIHTGNLTGDVHQGLRTHSHGCLLPGTRVGKIKGQRAVFASRQALAAIHDAVKRQTFLLAVQDVH